MRTLIITAGLMVFIFTSFSSLEAQSKRLPQYPSVKTNSSPSSHEDGRARELFELARSENARLKWNDCLARKAFRKARLMVKKDYFSHKDPDTGKNPAWSLVRSCFECRYAGENLSEGYESTKEVHRAFMKSKTHRSNITNSKFHLMGVGCYDHICVELFAGI
jgi:hypothetical protein